MLVFVHNTFERFNFLVSTEFAKRYLRRDKEKKVWMDGRNQQSSRIVVSMGYWF